MKKLKILLGSLLCVMMTISVSYNIEIWADTEKISQYTYGIGDDEATPQEVEEAYHANIDVKEYPYDIKEEKEFENTNSVVKVQVKAAASTIKIHYIKVGDAKSDNAALKRGDAILIECNGEFALIDAGPGDGLCNVYLEKIRKSRGGEDSKLNLKYVILTHHHFDHFGGLKQIIENKNIVVTKFYREKVHQHLAGTGKGCDAQSYKELMQKINSTWTCDYVSNLNVDNKNITNAVNASKTIKLSLGAATLYVYRPLSKSEDTNLGDGVYENNRSIICRVEFGDKTYLFTGDVYSSIIKRIAELGEKCGNRYKQLDTNILKIQHHGTLAEFTATIKGQYKNAFSPQKCYITNNILLKNMESAAKERNAYLTNTLGAALATNAEGTLVKAYSY